MRRVLADIPLIPAMSNENNNLRFVVHWLNNKEFHFTLESEKLLDELCRTRGASEESSSTCETPDGGGLQEPEEMHIANRGGAESLGTSPAAAHSAMTYAQKKRLMQRARDVLSVESNVSSTSSHGWSTASSNTLAVGAAPNKVSTSKWSCLYSCASGSASCPRTGCTHTGRRLRKTTHTRRRS